MRIPVRLPAKSKYRAQRTDGYASKKEAKRAGELEFLEKIGQIRHLEKQVKFLLLAPFSGIAALNYVADFVYEEISPKDGFWHDVVEDTKGVRTPVYKIKKRMMHQIRGIEIRET